MSNFEYEKIAPKTFYKQMVNSLAFSINKTGVLLQVTCFIKKKSKIKANILLLYHNFDVLNSNVDEK